VRSVYQVFNRTIAYRDKKLSVSLCVFRAPASTVHHCSTAIGAVDASCWSNAAAASWIHEYSIVNVRSYVAKQIKCRGGFLEGRIGNGSPNSRLETMSHRQRMPLPFLRSTRFHCCLDIFVNFGGQFPFDAVSRVRTSSSRQSVLTMLELDMKSFNECLGRHNVSESRSRHHVLSYHNLLSAPVHLIGWFLIECNFSFEHLCRFCCQMIALSLSKLKVSLSRCRRSPG
jgi:hypothetical protein